MVAIEAAIPREVTPKNDWRGGPPWFPWRVRGYRITLWADGIKYRARIADQTPAGLNLHVDDAGGQLRGRLFLCQLVDIVSGRRRIAGAVRYIAGPAVPLPRDDTPCGRSGAGVCRTHQ